MFEDVVAPVANDGLAVTGAALQGQRFARISAAVAVLVGVTVLFGWVFNHPTLTSVLPQLSSMTPLAALSFILAGVALGALSWPQRPSSANVAVALLAILIAFTASLTIIEYVAAVNLGFDTILTRDTIHAADTPYPGRMGFNTAIALLSIAIALVAKGAGTRRATWIAEGSAATAVLMALLAAIGYVYSAPSLTGIGWHAHMAIHSALTLLVLAIGLIVVPPQGPLFALHTSDGPGSAMLRRLVPPFSGLLIVIGWFRLVGQEHGYYGLQVGTAIMVTLSLVVFALLAIPTARALNAAAGAHALLDQQLRDRELRYRMIVNATFDGVVISQNGRIKEANAGYAAMFGYTQEELLGKSVFDLVAGESQALVTERIGAGSSGKYSVVGVRKDGTRFSFDTVVRVDGEGANQLRVAALRETTAQKRLEEQLRQSQKMEAIGQLAGGVAHDFNNLLTVILSYSTQLLQDRAVPDDRLDELAQIEAAAQSAARLTRQLLAFSRQQMLAPRVVSLNTIVDDTERLLHRLIGEDVALRSVLAPALHRIMADPGQIEQVLLNLAVNARDAMPNGGTLVLETANVRLDAAYAELHPEVTAGRYVQLIVTDSGIGMDAATCAHIFEPFFTTKAIGKGTGLGLASVYGVVQQTGGHIWVYSEPGHGTTFKLYFPAVPDDVMATPVSTAAIRSLQGSETILLAEDAKEVRQLARSVLASAGYTILEAADGVAALALARAHTRPIHLVLSDVVMPGLNGRELADQLLVDHPDLRVLFVSGYTTDTMLTRGILGPGMTLLQKPFTPDALLRAVREVLDAS